MSTPQVPDEIRPRHLRLPDSSFTHWSELHAPDSTGTLRSYLRRLWEYREFAATVPLGQLAARNQDTMLGRLWNLLNPLLLIAIYYFIFQTVLGIEDRRGVDNYLAFLTVGVITYNFTRSSVQGGALAIVRNRALVQSLHFPRVLLPVSSLIANTLSHLYAVVAMLAMLILMGVRPTWMWAALIPVLVMHGALNLGLSMFVARATFHFRDLERLLSYLLRLGLYVSGVLIPLTSELIPLPGLLSVLKANPIYLMIEATRNVLLGSPFDGRAYVLAMMWSLGVLALGFIYFRQAEGRYGNV